MALFQNPRTLCSNFPFRAYCKLHITSFSSTDTDNTMKSTQFCSSQISFLQSWKPVMSLDKWVEAVLPSVEYAASRNQTGPTMV